MNKKLLLTLLLFSSQVFGANPLPVSLSQHFHKFQTPIVEGGCYHYGKKTPLDQLDKQWEKLINQAIAYLNNKKEKKEKEIR